MRKSTSLTIALLAAAVFGLQTATAQEERSTNKPALHGTIPEHRTDSGPFLLAEFFGCPEVFFVKDEEGLYTDDPKKDPKATHIPRITAKELVDRNLNDLVIERVVVEYLPRARWCKELQIVNGLKPGQVLAALEGKDVGTIISA